MSIFGARFRPLSLAAFALLVVGGGTQETEHTDRGGRADRASAVPSIKTFAKQPLRFETNVGQAPEDVRFIAQGGGVRLSVEDTKATLHVRRGTKKNPAPPTELTLTVPGARKVRPVASEELPTKVNYLVGDRSEWHTNIATYSKVTYPSVLDGVDLVYHGDQGSLEYDFVVQPGADVAKVALDVSGTDHLSLNDRGDLIIETSTGTVVQQRPYVFQRDAKGVAHEVRAAFRVQGKNRVGFEVASYDHAQPLVIDPIIVSYATYLGNANGDDWITGVAADATGAAYAVGNSNYDAAPSGYTAPKYKSLVPPAPVPAASQGASKFFVARLNAAGQLDYITYGGGVGSDSANAIAVDANGNAYITGSTTSWNLPVTNDAVQQSSQAAFVAEIASDGASYLALQYLDLGPADGGIDTGYGIALVGSTVIVGGNAQQHYPSQVLIAPASVTEPNGCSCVRSACAADEVCACSCTKPLNGAFALGLPAGGGAQTFTRVYGGGNNAKVAAVGKDVANNVYIAGATDEDLSAVPTSGGYLTSWNYNHHAFVSRIASDTGAPSYGTYFITAFSNNDEATALVGGAAGQVYVTGFTSESSCTGTCQLFPTKSSGLSAFSSGTDTFVVHLDTNTQGTDGLVYSAILAGNGDDTAQGIALDGANQAFVTGYTSSTNYPTIPPHTGPIPEGQDYQMFLSVISADGNSLVASITLNGTGTDQAHAIAIRGTDVFVGGQTNSTGMAQAQAGSPSGVPAQPALAGEGGTIDGFLAKFSIAPLSISPTSKTVTSGDTVQFTGVGGNGVYTFEINPNNSGGSIDGNGLYHAGSNGNQTDTVVVHDGTSSANAVVIVQAAGGGPGPVPTDLALSPSAATSPPRGTVNFTASGGTPPYNWSLASNASGGNVNQNGLYTAGTHGLVVDTVRVVDANGITATALINVGPAITITPAQPSLAQKGTQQFTAAGGSGSYTWTSSDGAITAGGLFTAPAKSVAVTITATDALGNKATVNASVGGALAVTPVEATTYPLGVVHFSVVGGSGKGYAWTIIDPADPVANGGSTVNSTGGFLAGTKGNLDVVVEVHDSNGNHATVTVHIGPPLTINPTQEKRDSGGQVAFAAAGGSGEQYTFRIDPNNSHGSIGSDGLYTAGPTAGVDTIVLTDSAGNKATATVEVGGSTNGSGTSGGTSSSSGNPNGVPSSNPVSVGNGQITPVGGNGGDDGCAVVAGGGSKRPVSLGVGVLLGLGLLVRRRRARR